MLSFYPSAILHAAFPLSNNVLWLCFYCIHDGLVGHTSLYHYCNIPATPIHKHFVFFLGINVAICIYTIFVACFLVAYIFTILDDVSILCAYYYLHGYSRE